MASYQLLAAALSRVAADDGDSGNGQLIGKSLIAISRSGKRAGTDYVRIVLWGKQATNAAKYLAKGSSVSIVGRLRSEFYERRTVRARCG